MNTYKIARALRDLADEIERGDNTIEDKILADLFTKGIAINHEPVPLYVSLFNEGKELEEPWYNRVNCPTPIDYNDPRVTIKFPTSTTKCTIDSFTISNQKGTVIFSGDCYYNIAPGITPELTINLEI